MASRPHITKGHRLLIGRLVTAREEAGLTQEQAAERLHKSQSYVSKIETGHKDLYVSQLRAFAKLYKKDITDFLMWKGGGEV